MNAPSTRRILPALIAFLFTSFLSIPGGAVEPADSSQASQLVRKIAGFETAREAIDLMTRPDLAEALHADPLSAVFLRERFLGSPYAFQYGLSSRYVAWLFETLWREGPRARGAAASCPDFPLLPSVRAPSWKKVWEGGYSDLLSPHQPSRPASSEGSQAVVTNPSGAAIRLLPDPASREMGRFAAGMAVNVMAVHGSSLLVEAGGLAGFVDGRDFAVASGLPVLQPGSGVMGPGGASGFFTSAPVALPIPAAAPPAGRWTEWGWINY